MQLECHDVGVDTSSVGTATDPECLGPCEPGTSVMLEGIVWHETENGMYSKLVLVNFNMNVYLFDVCMSTRHHCKA